MLIRLNVIHIGFLMQSSVLAVPKYGTAKKKYCIFHKKNGNIPLFERETVAVK